MKKGVKSLIISISALLATIVSIVSTLIIVAAVLIVYLTFCFSEYGDKNIEKDGLVYELSNYKKECFVYNNGSIKVDGSLVIDIPDEVEGYKVRSLGGYIGRGYPLSFGIGVSDNYYITETWRLSCDELPPNAEVVEHIVTINIGKYVKDVSSVLTNYYEKEENSNIYHKVIYYFNCPEDNKYFYSVNGVLYNKSDDTPVIEYFS